MKKSSVLFLLVALWMVIPIGAQIRGNHINIMVSPDHQDWNYEVGQTALFKVSVLRSSTLVNDAVIDFEAGPEMYPDVKKDVDARLLSYFCDGPCRWESV